MKYLLKYIKESGMQVELCNYTPRAVSQKQPIIFMEHWIILIHH